MAAIIFSAATRSDVVVGMMARRWCKRLCWHKSKRPLLAATPLPHNVRTVSSDNATWSLCAMSLTAATIHRKRATSPLGPSFFATSSSLYTEFHGDCFPQRPSASTIRAWVSGSEITLWKTVKAVSTKPGVTGSSCG